MCERSSQNAQSYESQNLNETEKHDPREKNDSINVLMLYLKSIKPMFCPGLPNKFFLSNFYAFLTCYLVMFLNLKQIK